MKGRFRPLFDLFGWLAVVAIFVSYALVRREQIAIAVQRAVEANSSLDSKVAYAAVGSVSVLLLAIFSAWLTVALVRRLLRAARDG